MFLIRRFRIAQELRTPFIHGSYLNLQTISGNILIFVIGQEQEVFALCLSMSQKQAVNLPFASLFR